MGEYQKKLKFFYLLSGPYQHITVHTHYLRCKHWNIFCFLHCVKSVGIPSYSGPYFLAFELNTENLCSTSFSLVLFFKFFLINFMIFLQHFTLSPFLFPFFQNSVTQIKLVLLFTAENDSTTSLTSSVVKFILIIFFGVKLVTFFITSSSFHFSLSTLILAQPLNLSHFISLSLSLSLSMFNFSSIRSVSLELVI